MPCRGRAEQTVRNVKRLLATAGMRHGVDWRLWTVTGNDPELEQAIHHGIGGLGGYHSAEPLTYWQALAMATGQTDAPFIANLANDLLPGRDWLSRALAEYRCCFGTRDAMIGFNDGIHDEGLSPHFLISRGLLNQLGGWPVGVYSHNFGDAELCARAQRLGVYSKAPWATLFHNHVINGGQDDEVYHEGNASMERDRRTFEWRRSHNWPPYSETVLS